MTIHAKAKCVVKWISAAFIPVGLAAVYVAARVARVIFQEQEGWAVVGLEGALLCFIAVVIYAFFYTPWRLWAKFDSTALDGFAVSASAMFVVTGSMLGGLMEFQLPDRYAWLLLLSWVGLFVCLRAIFQYFWPQDNN